MTLTCNLVLLKLGELGVRADRIIRLDPGQCRAVWQPKVTSVSQELSVLLLVVYQRPVVVAEQVPYRYAVLVAQRQAHWEPIHDLALREGVQAQHFLQQETS